MYYAVYKITNEINGKIYIGCHKTKDLNDNYMGSGKYLKHSQEKHGIENFTKEILFVYDNPEQMFAKEAEIVTEDFIAEENTYNLKVGGFGGWDYINKNSLNTHNLTHQQYVAMGKLGRDALTEKLKNDPEFSESRRKSISESMKKYYQENGSHWKGKKHTEETKKKIGAKNSKYQSGSGNSQYGTRWIHSLSEKRSIRIKKEDPLPEGWVEGRKIKF